MCEDVEEEEEEEEEKKNKKNKKKEKKNINVLSCTSTYQISNQLMQYIPHLIDSLANLITSEYSSRS